MRALFALQRPRLFDDALFDFNDLVGFQSVRFTMHARGCFGAGRLNQAEHFTALLVEPILPVLDAVSVLRFDVGFVRVTNRIGGESVYFTMNVHKKGHEDFSLCVLKNSLCLPKRSVRRRSRERSVTVCAGRTLCTL